MNSTQEQQIDNFSTIEQKRSSCFFTYIKLILVPSLVYFYFILGYLGIIALPVHQHSLILMGVIFIVALIFARHNATYGRCYFQKNIENFNTNLKEYILKNLMSIGNQKKSNASYELFIENETKILRNNNYASVAAGIFPTLGILGTFISIAISMPNFASQTSNGLEKEISLLLSGVGTAFYVSIYGIFLSLWWIFFEKLGLSKFDKDIHAMKLKTQSLFWTKEEIEQNYLKENLDHFKEIGAMLSTLSNEKFFMRLGKSIEDKFDLFNKMIKLEEKSVQEASTYIKESLKSLKDAQQKEHNLGKVHSDILRTLQRFSIGLDDMQLKTKENFLKITDSQKGIDSSIQTLNNKLEKNISNLNNAIEFFPKNIQNIQEQILANFTSTLDNSVHRFWDESKLAAFDRQEKLEKLKLNEIKEDAEIINNQTDEIIESLEVLKSQDDEK